MMKSDGARTPRARPLGVSSTVRCAAAPAHGSPSCKEERAAGPPRRSQAGDQHLAAGRGQGQGPAEVERVPAREQRINLEAPGQLENVLQGARLGLWDIDRLLLLVD